MTRRDWLLPGALLCLSAACFTLAWWLGRVERVQDRIEEQRGG